MSPKFEDLPLQPDKPQKSAEKPFVVVRTVTPEGLKEEKRFAGESFGKAARVPEARQKKTEPVKPNEPRLMKVMTPELTALRQSKQMKESELELAKARRWYAFNDAVKQPEGSEARKLLGEQIETYNKEVERLTEELEKIQAKIDS